MQRRGWFDPKQNSYLHLYEMEWMPLEAIAGKRDSFFQLAIPSLIPFAFTGGGDHWCWYPQHAEDGDIPVVLCPRDSEIGEFYAPNFIGAIYRQILDCLSAADASDSQKYFKRWMADLVLLFPDDWRNTLAALLASPLKSVKSNPKFEYPAFLTPAECSQLVDRQLGFEKLNEAFRWMAD